ncbi:epithelial-stromal interaction protein 1 [Gouania willdenowi]|uniref:epithelial-stromal interaction protein 1 n=1 Tax=Gouania willdenowi TaxID=441366 RepID=UPI001056AC68|nr:epithelial-stromal interaction protein 1-like [Gouania willdenowi]
MTSTSNNGEPVTSSSGVSAREVDRTPRRCDGAFSMFPPNQRRRNEMMSVAQKEEELLQKHKENNKVSAVHTHPEQLGGYASLPEVRAQQAMALKCSKFEKKVKKMDLDERRRQEEREKDENMKAEQRRKAERLEKKMEEKAKQERNDPIRQRVNSAFLDKK